MKADLNDSPTAIAQKLGKMMGRNVVITLENATTGSTAYDYKIYAGILHEFRLERIKLSDLFEITLKVGEDWRNGICVRDGGSLKWSIEMFDESLTQGHF